MPHKPFTLLGVDLGTTHVKAALFDEHGRLLQLASLTNHVHRTPWRPSLPVAPYFDPHQLWETASEAIRQVTATPPAPLAGVGVASMAETGLLLDLASGAPRTPLLPWFDNTAAPQAAYLAAGADTGPAARFRRTGMYPNFKCALARLLWLREAGPSLLPGAVWLSTADYLVYRLAGVLATDYSLAGRTYAFDLDRREWDFPWLERFGLAPENFPGASPSGTPVGKVSQAAASFTGLPAGLPVVIGGHDHVCGAYAVGATEPGTVFDSMGTAEALVGALPARPLGVGEQRSGLVFGHHAAPGRRYWMGGLSASGGSVEWLRALLGSPPLTYDQVEDLVKEAPPVPTGILYFPYLSGSSSPHTDLNVRAAFIGLDSSHKRSDLARAVLEGTAFEMEYVRRTAERASGEPVERLLVAGGGSRSPNWMQIKADISGCRLDVLHMAETTLLGAALLAGTGAGLLSSSTAPAGERAAGHEVYTPDPARHDQYRRIFEDRFLPLQAPLRELAQAG